MKLAQAGTVRALQKEVTLHMLFFSYQLMLTVFCVLAFIGCIIF